MLLCLASYPSNVQLSMKYLEGAQSCQRVQQQGKGEAGFHHWSLDSKGRDPAVWGPWELSGPSWIDTALPELPQWYATGVAFPKRTGGYKPFNTKAWSISSCGQLVFPMLPNCTTSTGAQYSDSSKFTPIRQNHLFLLFLLCFPLAPFHTPYCRKALPKFKTLRGN